MCATCRNALAAACLALTACGAAPPEPAHAPASHRPPPHVPLSAPPLAGPAALPGRALAEMPNEQTELHVASRGGSGLLVARIGASWQAAAFDGRQGAPLPTEQSIIRLGSEPQNAHDIGAAPEQDTLGALEPVGKGYLFTWLVPVGTEREIRALALDESGKPAGKAVVVTRVAGQVRWVDVLPNASGALLLWDSERSDGRELSVAAWTAAGPGKPAAVARSVLGWQVASSAHELAIATVSGAASKEGSATGRLALLRIAPDGTVAAPVPLGEQPTAQPDVQLAALSDRYLVAWTDASDTRQAPGLGAGDPHVLVAAVGLDGKVLVPPRPAVDPVGEQALGTLVASHDGAHALLGWEPLLQRDAGQRRIELCLLGADGKRGAERTSLEFRAPSDTPLLAAAAGGYAALTLAAPTLASADPAGPPLDPASVVPTVVRLGDDLGIQASEPVRVAELGEPGVPQQMRNVSCSAERCTGLAIGATEPARVVLVELPVRQSPWGSAARQLPASGTPTAQALTTVQSAGEPVSEIAARRLGNGSDLVAWITHVAPMPGREKAAERGATLALRVVGPGSTVGEARTLSEHALSLGGVAVEAAPDAAAAGGKGSKAHPPAAVLAWVGPNNNTPQVYVTSVADDGGKIGQKTVTQLHGKAGSLEVSDVDIASDKRGGYIVAWTDNRDGNPEIYAARIAAGLERSVPDQRVTQAPGSSAEVRIAMGRDRVLLVWSDARERAEEGLGAIFLAALDPKTLKKLGPEQRLFQSELNARTPGVAPAGDGFVVWWIEEPADVGATGPSGLRLVRLDAKGQPLGAVRWLPPAPGWRLTSATLGCKADSCRVLVAAGNGAVQRLDAFALGLGPEGTSRGSATGNEPLVLLGGISGQDPSLSASDPSLDAAYLLGVKLGEGTRVRRLGLGW